MSGTEGAGTGKNQALDLRSLRGSVSEDALSSQEADAEASPQSFAALKQAYDFMVPQFKALQTDKRSLQKENEELKKKLTDKEEQPVEMSDNSEDGYPSDLKSKGHSAKRTSAAITGDEQGDQTGHENGDFRISPCSAMDSAINLNDGNSLIIEKSVREEREKWERLCWTMLYYLAEETLPNLKDSPEHCLERLTEYASSVRPPERDVVMAKINRIKMAKSNPGGDVNMKTTQLVTSLTLGYAEVGVTRRQDLPKGSPGAGKYGSVGTSEDDPSDEDIYTSGLPGKRRSKKKSRAEDDEEEEEEELVRVDDAMDVLTRCADFLHQSLEVNMTLLNKFNERQQFTDKGSGLPVGAADTGISFPMPPVKPSRSHLPISDGRKRQAMTGRQFDRVRQLPSAASDPGRIPTGVSHLNLTNHYNSDPISARRWDSVQRSRGRPYSEADLSGQLNELSVKYPPMPYQPVSSVSTQSCSGKTPPLPPQGSLGNRNPATTIDHNFQFDDGLTYQPCGPPETDMKPYGSHEEDDEVRSWNAARNPDLYEGDFKIPPSQAIFSRSDPVKHYSPTNFSDSSRHERYLPRSSDRIYDMGHQHHLGGGSHVTSNVTRASHSKSERGSFQLPNEPIQESPVCPVCEKVFDPSTPDVAVSSHVNLHFENDANNFEVIE